MDEILIILFHSRKAGGNELAKLTGSYVNGFLRNTEVDTPRNTKIAENGCFWSTEISSKGWGRGLQDFPSQSCTPIILFDFDKKL